MGIFLLLGAEQPARPRPGAVALWEGRDSLDAPGLLEGLTWTCGEEREARLAWAASPYLSLAETPKWGVSSYGLSPPDHATALNKWTLDSCLLLPGTDVILRVPDSLLLLCSKTASYLINKHKKPCTCIE